MVGFKMKLYVICHPWAVNDANQVANERSYGTPLTDKDRLDTISIVDKLQGVIDGRVRRVVSSPVGRAPQVAQIIADKFGTPVTYDASIAEHSCLPAGMSARDELRARAIYFLERYMDVRGNLTEIILSDAGVSHAIMAMASESSETIPCRPLDTIHQLENPWSSMAVERLDLAKTSEAYAIGTTGQTYVMKRIRGANGVDLAFQHAVSNHVARDSVLLSRVLFHGIRQERAIQVLNYFVGVHNRSELTDPQRINLLTAVHELGCRLKTVPDSLRELYDHSLKQKVEACVSILDGLPRKVGQRLMASHRYKYLTASVPQVLVHYDLHRSNVLFTQSDDVKILDLGDMIYSPADFLPASLFMSFFLLQDQDKFKLDELISEWPQPIDKQDIVLLMRARAIIGLSFFQQAISGETPRQDDVNLYKKYLKAINWLEGGH